MCHKSKLSREIYIDKIQMATPNTFIKKTLEFKYEESTISHGFMLACAGDESTDSRILNIGLVRLVVWR
ncbi:hypothetical protein MASR2M64_05240 [Candidatus Cloacimonadota bacterium]